MSFQIGECAGLACYLHWRSVEKETNDFSRNVHACVSEDASRPCRARFCTADCYQSCTRVYVNCCCMPGAARDGAPPRRP
eukprot:1750336-Pleurochrysis_carterae.AAC.2